MVDLTRTVLFKKTDSPISSEPFKDRQSMDWKLNVVLYIGVWILVRILSI